MKTRSGRFEAFCICQRERLCKKRNEFYFGGGGLSRPFSSASTIVLLLTSCSMPINSEKTQFSWFRSEFKKGVDMSVFWRASATCVKKTSEKYGAERRNKKLISFLALFFFLSLWRWCAPPTRGERSYFKVGQRQTEQLFPFIHAALVFSLRWNGTHQKIKWHSGSRNVMVWARVCCSDADFWWIWIQSLFPSKIGPESSYSAPTHGSRTAVTSSSPSPDD